MADLICWHNSKLLDCLLVLANRNNWRIATLQPCVVFLFLSVALSLNDGDSQISQKLAKQDCAQFNKE